MSTKKWEQEREEMQEWYDGAPHNSRLGFRHMAENIAREKKLPIERARVQAYKRMKKKGLIKG